MAVELELGDAGGDHGQRLAGHRVPDDLADTTGDLVSLQGLPAEYFESARIDGAGAWQRLRFITLPLLTPHFLFLLITQFITSFQVFGLIYVMTKGGPGHATSVYIFNIYQNAFGFGKIGYASAMAWILFAVIAAVTYLQWKLQKRWVFYS